jgi:hypothetical protein
MEFKDYDTLSEAMNDLIKQGYTTDFLLLAEKDCLKCNKTSLHLSPDEFEIDHLYHFDAMSDPGDDMLLFAISSKKRDAKGLVVNAYGVYADSLSSGIVDKLRTHVNK